MQATSWVAGEGEDQKKGSRVPIAALWPSFLQTEKCRPASGLNVFKAELKSKWRKQHYQPVAL